MSGKILTVAIATTAKRIAALDLSALPAHDDLVAAYTAKHGKPPPHRMTDKTIAEAIA